MNMFPAFSFFLDGDDGKGSATVYTKVKFDREQQKEYHVPIVIADSGIPSLTSTNTLTVIIGDENDNIMYPGEKDIFVYSYKSELVFDFIIFLSSFNSVSIFSKFG